MERPRAVIGEREGRECGMGDFNVTLIENYRLQLSDGIDLACRLWFPGNLEEIPTDLRKCSNAYEQYSPKNASPFQPQPVVLEYLPYRQSDYTAPRDHQRHPWMSSHGYIVARVDMRGAGDSQGQYFGEYLAQEQTDAVEIIDWFSKQAWTNGKVGMYGKSWGGFNSLEVAYEQPPALKAIITLYSSDDRYANDIHYQGGCVMGNEMLSWASQMHLWNARPPSPIFVDDWKEQWRLRLENTSDPWVVHWLSHQFRDEFWKHGSICEDPKRLRNTAVLAIGGAHDGYRESLFRMAESLENARCILGPWCHDWPDVGMPGPLINFTALCLEWWDHHLKAINNGAMDCPKLRCYLQDGVTPAPQFTHMFGKWVSDKSWPPPEADRLVKFIPDVANHELHTFSSIRGDLDPDTEEVGFNASCGLDAGPWLAMDSWGYPGDQNRDDELSLCWNTKPLEKPLAILGNPELHCTVSASHDRAIMSARIGHVHPDGRITLIAYGLLNLTHHKGHEPDDVEPLRPNEAVRAVVKFMGVSYVIPARHQLRLSVSPCYWPTAWPSKDAVMLKVHTGSGDSSRFRSELHLPVYDAEEPSSWDFGSPQLGPLLPHDVLSSASEDRGNVQYINGVWIKTDKSSSGKLRIPSLGVTMDETSESVYSIEEGKPLSAKVTINRQLQHCWSSADDKQIAMVDITHDSEMTADGKKFLLNHKLQVFLDGETFFNRSWHDEVPRKYV